ncbi:hypothetical protein [Actinoplanes palleronii]|uniref:Uncharacterized protein n=1 Tax=Actinoplanes palleronii TaxID=113570 RepID=A0ABQ4B7G9_9ACTN|nr:hypothetical protein [Actinoplanes palleronii]GIE66613.1 hypothetical protein Apa02nite_027210 [Actinoplanes palleronii]
MALLRRSLVLLVLVLGTLGVFPPAAAPAWASAGPGEALAFAEEVPSGLRWPMILAAASAVLLLVIGGEMWWLSRRPEPAPMVAGSESEVTQRVSSRV